MRREPYEAFAQHLLKFASVNALRLFRVARNEATWQSRVRCELRLPQPLRGLAMTYELNHFPFFPACVAAAFLGGGALRG